MTPGNKNIVRIPIDKARVLGKYNQYKAVAVEETASHLRVEESAWRAISGRVLHGVAGMAKSSVGADAATPEVIAAQLVVCEACEQSGPSDKPVMQRRCGRLMDVLKPALPTCGCALIRKAKLQSESCPLGKW